MGNCTSKPSVKRSGMENGSHNSKQDVPVDKSQIPSRVGTSTTGEAKGLANNKKGRHSSAAQSSILRNFSSSNDELRWHQLYHSHARHIVDPADVHSVLDDCISDTINQLKSAETTLILRRVRKIVQSLLNTASSSNGSLPNTSSTVSWSRGVPKKRNGDHVKTNGFQSSSMIVGRTKNLAEDNKSRLIYQKDGNLDEHLVRKIFLAGHRCLIVGAQKDRVQKSLDSYLLKRSDDAESIWSELLLNGSDRSRNGSKRYISAESNLSVQSSARREKKTDVVATSSNILDPIKTAYILLLHLSEQRWDYAASVAKISAAESGLELDVNKQGKSKSSSNTPPPPPFEIDRKESDKLPSPALLPSGVDFRSLCYIIALASYSSRRKRLVLLFYLLMDPKQLTEMLKQSPNGGIPSWLFEADSNCIISFASLSHYYYFGGTPYEEKKRPNQPGAGSPSEVRISILNAIETIAVLLHYDIPEEVNDKGASPKASSPEIPPIISENQNRQRALSFGDKKYRSAKMHVMLAEYLHKVRKSGTVPVFENKSEQEYRSQYMDAFWDASHQLYSNLKNQREHVRDSWRFDEFMLWANTALPDDSALDIVMNQIFGMGLLPTPSMERALVSQSWIEWQVGESHLFYDEYMSSTFSAVTQGIKNLFSFSSNEGSEQSSSNSYSLESSIHTSIDQFIGDNLAWGGVGGYDGRGALGNGILYCIEKDWWENWMRYVKWQWNDSSITHLKRRWNRPHELSNEKLLDRGSDSHVDGALGSYEIMKRNLKKDTDYVLVPPGVWNILYELYGGGPPLPRMIINKHNAANSEGVSVVDVDLKKYLLDNPSKLPSALNVVTHPWILGCHVCDPHQPYRRGDVGAISIRIMVLPDQPLWRLFSEIITRLPVIHPRGKDSRGVGKGRLWKKVDASEVEGKEGIRYGPWTLLCNKGFAYFPVSDTNNNSSTSYKEDWEEYTENATVEGIGLNDGTQLMFEYALFAKSDEKVSWPRDAAAKAGKLQQAADEEASFRQMLRGLDSNGDKIPDTSKLIGRVIDSLDSSGRWYQAEITGVDDGSNSDSDDTSDDSNYSEDYKNDGNPTNNEVRAIRVDFSDVGGNEEWIDVNSDRLAIAGRFTRDSMKSMENLEGGTNGPSNGGSKSRSLVLKKHATNESSTFQINRQLCSYPGFGACGLTNLGNTCYANAAIQCISCLPLIRSYLVSAQFKTFDINRNNPLGTGGKLLEEFAELLKVIWSGKYGIRSPTRFRYTLGRARQQYSAADQQDAQEFLNDMLDSLHEDSNKVVQKPYVEAVEDDWVDKSHLPRVGEETWRRFLRRNRSVIVNTAMGQVLNRVTCPKCAHTSLNFDPFNMLSIPFPTTTEVLFRCQVVRRASAVNCSKILGLPSQRNSGLFNGYNIMSPPSKQLLVEEYIISISRLSDVSDLKAQVQNRSGLAVDRFKLCSVDVIDNNTQLSMKDPKRLFMNIKALPEKDGPCLQLLKGPLSGNQTVLQCSTTTIIAFETTINPRPGHYANHADLLSSNQGKEAKIAADSAISQFIEDYGDEMECRLYDSDPLLLSKVISRRLWPRKSSDFKLGLRVDAIDQRQKWFPGTVIEIIKAENATNSGRKTRVKVHFDNFSAKWDLLYSIDNFEKGKLQPLYSHSQPRETPMDLLIHHRYGSKVASLFGQTFFVQCHVEWSTARAGAHILAQAGKYLECLQQKTLSDEEGKIYQDAWSAVTKLIDFLLEADKAYVTSALDLQSGAKVDGNEHTSFFLATLEKMLPLLPFEILICDTPPQLKKESRGGEVPFVYSLLRTIGNYFNARQVLVLHWKDYKVQMPSQIKTFILFTPPFISRHQRSMALLRKQSNGKETGDNNAANNIYPGMPLGSCLDEFCKEQQLGNSEGWRCPKCKEVREGRQSMTLWRLPDLLTFHLKRFNCSARWREKITTKVNFPLTGLNMKRWCDMESPVFQGSEETYVYDLVGVVNHYGGMTGGHYVATCKATACTPEGSEEVEHNFNGAGVHAFGAQVESGSGWGWKLGRGKERDTPNGKTFVAESQSKAIADSSEPLWLQFDDDSVEPILPRDVVSETAYVLFYRRRQISPSNISRYSTPS